MISTFRIFVFMKRLQNFVCLVAMLLLPMSVVQAQENRTAFPPQQTTLSPSSPYTELLSDSLRLNTDPVFNIPSQTREMPSSRAGYDIPASRQSADILPVWKGGVVGVYGANDHMPGLMDISSGRMALHQDFGRLHLTLSANANKYWMPMQNSLFTQYGLGGHLSFDVSERVSLHAFGNYYFNNLHASPAISPYAYSTSFGAYADIRFSEHWGTNLGAQRYLNPMNGRWETDPIVTPYYKFNNGTKLEIPLGHLIKRAIWGESSIDQPPMPVMMRPIPGR